VLHLDAHLALAVDAADLVVAHARRGAVMRSMVRKTASSGLFRGGVLDFLSVASAQGDRRGGDRLRRRRC